MGRASRAKLERLLPSNVNGVLVARTGRRFYYRGRIVGFELAPLVPLPAVENPPAAPLEAWEEQAPWSAFDGGL